MKRYEEYKPSGVEWFGQIPQHWLVLPLRRLASIGNGKDYKNIEVDEGGYPVYGTGGEFARCSEFLHDKPSVLLGRKGTINKPLIVIEPFWTSDTIYYTIIGKKILPEMLYHLVWQIPFELYEYGSAIPSMTKSDYEEMKFPIPPPPEQHQIVAYLDRKTAQIDELLEKKKRKIELLKEYRTALINQVVTKGLDPNVEMKDSGVEWIGDIPKHWDVLSLKYFGDVVLGKMLTPLQKEGFELKPYLRSINIQDGVIDISDVNQMWFSSSELQRLRLKEGDLLLNEGGDVGRSSLWNNEIEECYFQNSVNRVRFSNDISRYFFYLSQTYHHRGHYDSIVSRVSIPHLTKEKLESANFIRPPLSEQHQIIEHLDRKTSEIDQLILSERNKINLLKEYRQSLISNVVTGKVDVRKN